MVHYFKNFAKVTAEPTVVKGQAYFPIYEPTKSLNKCSLGDAYICGVDDECGTNISSNLVNLWVKIINVLGLDKGCYQNCNIRRKETLHFMFQVLRKDGGNLISMHLDKLLTNLET